MMTQRSIFSAQFVSMNLIMVSAICLSAGTPKIMCTNKERQALLKFKQGLVDESNFLSSWESQKDCCNWGGISCHNQTGHVVKLDLSYNLSDNFASGQPLAGEIGPSLLELQDLNYLDLSFNSFHGLEIPNFIASLGELKHLKLSSVGFVGAIPNQLGNLSNLQTLDLSLNSDLTVASLDWLPRLSSLKFLNLSRLNLSEVLTWPQSINKLPSLLELQFSSCNLHDVNPSSLSPNYISNSLRVLDLSDNRLSPSVFFWVSNISTKLVLISLSGCQMQGQIPDVFANLESLVSLDLSYNLLEGGLPRSFRNLCRLESLNLLQNTLDDRLYDSIKNLSCSEETMKHLSLSGNPFSGPFPDLSRFSSLIELYLDVTNVTGPLPSNISQFSKLVSLSLGSNKLNGPLPDFTGLSSLRQLFLSGNQFNGSVPDSLGQLSNLEYLDISSNSLDGVLTESHFSNLSSLLSLGISENHLSLNLSSDWIPPFQLNWLYMDSCKVGPGFPKWLQTQKNLSSLYASNAGISDSIPEKFWDLSTTLNTLNLSSNQIHGNLPNLSSSDYAYFSIDSSSNNFDGPIPLLPPTVSDVFLSKNKFSGSISSSLCDSQTPTLSHLDLSDNLLSGELPDCWTKLPSLLFLNLAKNNFSGTIPSSLSSLRNIMLLRLHDNNLSGEMPSLENCTELRVVDLGSNKLSGRVPSLSGKNLPKLLVLRLRRNELSEGFPSSLCSLPSLHVLDFSHNKISGELPECLNNVTALSYDVTDNIILGFVQVVWKGIEREFGDNLRHLRSIDISNNSLSGVIPENITGLLKLVSLNLSRNNLAGSIPRDFDKLGSLESLDLSRNRLSGLIPASFASLNFLSYLDLSYNDLRGRIPSSTQLQSFNATSYVGNVELCGLPLTKYCPGDKTDQDPSVIDGNASEESEGDEDKIITSGFYVSIGVGFFVGFWGVCGTLFLKKSRRLFHAVMER